MAKGGDPGSKGGDIIIIIPSVLFSFFSSLFTIGQLNCSGYSVVLQVATVFYDFCFLRSTPGELQLHSQF